MNNEDTLKKNSLIFIGFAIGSGVSQLL